MFVNAKKTQGSRESPRLPVLPASPRLLGVSRGTFNSLSFHLSILILQDVSEV